MEEKKQDTATPKLSPEEMDKRQRDMDKFFKEQITFLTTQRDYEAVMTEIEELRARRVRAQMMVANALASAPPEPQENEEEKGPVDDPKERKLKIEKA